MIHKKKTLYDEGNGLGFRTITRQLGISRNTLKKTLRMDGGTSAGMPTLSGR